MGEIIVELNPNGNFVWVTESKIFEQVMVLFLAGSQDYQLEVLPAAVPTLAVEAAAGLGWDRWADDSVSLDRFGASAKGSEALAKLGYTPENVAERARILVNDLREDG